MLCALVCVYSRPFVRPLARSHSRCRHTNCQCFQMDICMKFFCHFTCAITLAFIIRHRIEDTASKSLSLAICVWVPTIPSMVMRSLSSCIHVYSIAVALYNKWLKMSTDFFSFSLLPLNDLNFIFSAFWIIRSSQWLNAFWPGNKPTDSTRTTLFSEWTS